MSGHYAFGEIEQKWQHRWEEAGCFRAASPGEPGSDRPKFYCLDMFPYPSGDGLHVGHPEGYTATDIICRYRRMRGENVLHPMGWDAFGLPAEQHAIRTGVHPAQTTRRAIDNFRRQLKRFGFSYDWQREFATIDPEYYRWTQWIFLRLYGAWYDPQAISPGPRGERLGRARPIPELIHEFAGGTRPVRFNPDAAETTPEQRERRWASWSHATAAEQAAIVDSYRLAYLSETAVNWCPKLGTALANEEVIDGRSERGDFPVFRKSMKQWLLRITAYAERLLRDLAHVDWPESTRAQQSEWIGRSEGAYLHFPLADDAGAPGEFIRVFTTRPDTLFGATYVVLAPEHRLVARIAAAAERSAVEAYVAAARQKSDLARTAETRAKTGVFTGAYAINPGTQQRIPIWVADYVLGGYGTGAIMAVPAHDARDFEFAQQFKLPIRDVVYPRTVSAMRFFAANATPAESGLEDWASRLADFLGVVITRELDEEHYGEALRVIRTGRAADARFITGEEPPPPAPPPNRVGPIRGVVFENWREAIESLGFDSFSHFRRTLGMGTYYAFIGEAYVGEGWMVNSTGPHGGFDGRSSIEARRAITTWLGLRKLGEGTVQYKLRDWVFSRQRYWGEPFPIVYDAQGQHHAVSEEALPVLLPELVDYAPVESEEPQPLLAKAADWVNTTAGAARVPGMPAETAMRRETNTMPGWAGSCWYYLRYCDPKNAQRFASPAAERYWLDRTGVDLYVGGAEHAVLHLLYARFWHKVLFDLGEVGVEEPFRRLFHQGLITSFAFQRPDGSLAPTDAVRDEGEGRYVEIETGKPVAQIVAKMSKSLKNVVNPDDVIAAYGADTFRLYEMYMGPLEASKPWNTRDIVGPHRFLHRVWRLAISTEGEDPAAAWRINPRISEQDEPRLERLLHKTIRKVQGDIDALAFNTAIAQMIVWVNEAQKAPSIGRSQLMRFLKVLSPFAPHIAEELHERLGGGLLATAEWPAYDEALTRDELVEIAVQVNGKLRGRVHVAADADQAAMIEAARSIDAVARELAEKPIRRTIAVPGRLVNFST